MKKILILTAVLLSVSSCATLGGQYGSDSNTQNFVKSELAKKGVR